LQTALGMWKITLSFVGKSGAIIVGVLSTSDNASWRNAIRATWTANSTVFFVIAGAGSWNEIKEEYREYKDIICGLIWKSPSG